MSAKRVKRDSINLATPPVTGDLNETPHRESEHLRQELALKNDVLSSLEEFVNKMQKGLCCTVCTELLYQPFTLGCGHVFCYTCLMDWFKEAKRCPTCRERVTEKPRVSYLIKEMVNSFVVRAELVDPEGSGARFNKEKTEADKAVRDAQANLFPGYFMKHVQHPLNRMMDHDDGVLRCIRCHWEVEGPTCVHCGLSFSGDEEDSDHYTEDDEDEDDESDMDDDDYDEDYFDSQDHMTLADYIFRDQMAWGGSDDGGEYSEGMEDFIDDEAENSDDHPEGHEEDDSSLDGEEEEEEGILADDTEASVRYHTRANNYYNPLESSTDHGINDSESEEDDEEEDEEEEEHTSSEEEDDDEDDTDGDDDEEEDDDEDEDGDGDEDEDEDEGIRAPKRLHRSRIDSDEDSEEETDDSDDTVTSSRHQSYSKRRLRRGDQ